MFRTNRKVPRWLVTIADDTGKLVQRPLTFSEFEFNIVLCDGIKHKAAETMSRFETLGKNETPLYDEVPVLNIPQKTFACVPQTEITDFQSNEEP